MRQRPIRRSRPALRGPGSETLGSGVLVVAGILLVAVAWAGASGREVVGEQLPYLNLGVGGVVMVGAGLGVYLLGMRRSLRLRRAELATHPRLAPLNVEGFLSSGRQKTFNIRARGLGIGRAAGAAGGGRGRQGAAG